MEAAEKHFHKRNAILACLQRTKEHPSADMLYRMLQDKCSDISRASVYRNLVMFKKQGLISSLGTVNGTERFDGCVEPHVHFACDCCGRVMDVPEMAIPEKEAQEAAQMSKFRVRTIQVVLSGICEECMKTNP